MSDDDEINLVVIDSALVEELDRQFNLDIERSIELECERWKKRPIAQRVIERTTAPFRSVS